MTFDLASGLQHARFANLEAYLAERIEMPDDAIDAAVEGDVVLAVRIRATGEVAEVRLEEGIGYGCDALAMKVVSTMPAWTPATNYGVPVADEQRISVRFRLP